MYYHSVWTQRYGHHTRIASSWMVTSAWRAEIPLAACSHAATETKPLPKVKGVNVAVRVSLFVKD